MTTGERLATLEQQMKDTQKQLEEQCTHLTQLDTQVLVLNTDKAKVLAGAWAANLVGGLLLCVVMYLGNKAYALELVAFKDAVIKEVRAANGKVP